MNCDLAQMPLDYADAFAWGWRTHSLGEKLSWVQECVEKNKRYHLARVEEDLARAQDGGIDGWNAREVIKPM